MSDNEGVPGSDHDGVPDEEAAIPDEVDIERVEQMVAGRDAEHRAERIEYTRPSIVRAAVVVAAVVIGAVVLAAVATVVWWLVIAAALGALLYPASAFLKRHMPAGLALVLIVVVMLGIAGWLGVRGLNEVRGQTESMRASALTSAQEAEASPDYGATARRIGLSEKVNSAFDSVPGSSTETSAPLQFVSSSGGALFSIAMLALLFVIFWPQLFHGALRQSGATVRRDRLGAHLRASYWSCARYAWLMIARSLAIGVIAGFTAQLLGSGAPTVIGLWFALWAVVPGLGLVMAVVPLAAVDLVHSPPQAAAILVAAIVVQAVDAIVVQKRIDRTGVRVGPALSLVALMLGSQLYGVGGAIVALAGLIFGLAFLDSLTDYRRDLTGAMKRLTRSDEDTVTGRQTTAAVNDADGSVTWWYELGWRTPLAGALALVGLAGFVAVTVSGPVIALVATAVLLSFGFDPIISRLEGWLHQSRGVIVGCFFCLVTAVAIGGIAAFLPSTVDQAGTVQQDLPRAVEDLTALPVIGPVLADNHAPDRIREWAESLPSQISDDTSGITAAASTVGTAVLAALLIGFLLIALLIDGPHLVRLAQVAAPQPRVALLSRFGTLISKTAGRYFSGSLVLAGLQALQVLVTGLVLGVPLTPVLAVWAGIWTLVPQVGGAIGGLPFILLAFSHSAASGLIALAVFGLYLVIANNVLLPIIVGKAVDASPLATMAATIAGFTLLGVIGAILAVPIFGATKSIYKQLRPTEDEVRRPRRHPPGRVRRRIIDVRERAEGRQPPNPTHVGSNRVITVPGLGPGPVPVSPLPASAQP